MTQRYSILRDLSLVRTSEPFHPAARTVLGGALGGTAVLGGTYTLAEPQIEVADLTKRELHDLARDPEVQALAPIMPTKLIEPLAGAAPAAATTTAWGVSAVHADISARTGAGVTVAVLDTGIDRTHTAFAGVNITEHDFSGSGNGDVQGHGTHCAGTILGRDVDGTRIGVARGVETLLIGKVLGDDGSGDSEMIFRGIQWATQEKAHVVSMSLGFDFPGMVKRLVDDGWPVDLATSAALEAYRANLRMFDALMEVAQSAAAFGTGTVIVAAAGNESERQIDPQYEIGVSLPAAADGVISVGALGQSAAGFQIAPFSNTFPQVSGPGVDIVSAKAGGGLRSLSGTSMATPHVAGVAALWWEEVLASALPHTAVSITARLLARAQTTGFAPDVDVADRGAGLVQAP
ncbi:S8 family peptidase [Pengzhenrongella sicca]|uniref:S8 family serine peptidase n=1 Tax=Pengzhenrongella sicca TaxID=2819238 RepID=A0A8A4Z8M9_9MICO|nr:S8 family serine peptidase [Pengzhenrongella sicca]QTE28232.1 S8 family serine peptidase [Pengzhenrongella sicca]